MFSRKNVFLLRIWVPFVARRSSARAKTVKYAAPSVEQKRSDSEPQWEFVAWWSISATRYLGSHPYVCDVGCPGRLT